MSVRNGGDRQVRFGLEKMMRKGDFMRGSGAEGLYRRGVGVQGTSSGREMAVHKLFFKLFVCMVISVTSVVDDRLYNHCYLGAVLKFLM